MEKFSRKLMTFEEMIEKANIKHNFKYVYPSQDYKNGRSKIKILCKKHGEFTQLAESHLTGKGCPSCAGNKKYNIDTLLKKMNSVHSNKFIYILINFKNNDSIIEIKCPIHGYFNMKVGNHIHGQGCRKCSVKNLSYSTAEFIEICNKVHNFYYDYSSVDYKSYKFDICIKCPSHGTFTQNSRTHLRGHGCPSCNLSKGEYQIELLLKEKVINYKKQAKFDGCFYKKKLPFDFYLPDTNTCIEFDGYQHFEPIGFFGGEKAYEIQKLRDNIKNEYCKSNDIKLYRIRYDDDVDEKIINILNEIQI